MVLGGVPHGVREGPGRNDQRVGCGRANGGRAEPRDPRQDGRISFPRAHRRQEACRRTQWWLLLPRRQIESGEGGGIKESARLPLRACPRRRASELAADLCYPSDQERLQQRRLPVQYTGEAVQTTDRQDLQRG